MTDDLEKNRAPFLYIKLCAWFRSYRWIQTGVTVRKHSIRVKISNFLSRVTLNFDGWPWKIVGHLFYSTSKLCAAFHSHLWIQTWVTVRKRQIWFKIGNFCQAWPWNLTDDLEKDRVPLLSSIKLCASFHRHIWIQTGDTVRGLNGAMTSVTLTFDLYLLHGYHDCQW